jgi:hypothetical protein
MLRARNNFALLSTCFALLAGGAGQVRADDDVLKLVPEKALGFVIVNRPETADAKLQELGQQLKLPIPSLLAKLEGPGGIQAGLDKKRPISVLLLPPNEGMPIPAVIILVPVTDYAKFLDGLKPDETADGVSKVALFGSPSLTRNVGSYAAITGEPFRDVLKNLKSSDNVPAAFGSWQDWLAKKDVAAVVFAPGIRMASEKLQQGVGTMKATLAQAGPQGQQAVAVLDMYVRLFKSAEKEVSSVGISLERNRQGAIRFCKRACLVPGGNWAHLAGELGQNGEQDVLAGLPGGPFVIAGGAALPEDAMPEILNWSFNLIKNMHELYGLSEEQAGTLAELAKVKFPAIRGFSFQLGAAAGEEPILSRMIGLMRPVDGKTYLADYEKFIAAYNKIVAKVDSPMFRQIECEKTDVEGIASLKVTMTVPQLPNMPPQSEKMIEAMYGPGGKIVARIVPVNENTVLIGYGGDEPLHQAIASVKEGKPGLSGDEGIAKVSKLLPKGAMCRAYISPSGVLDFVKRMATVAIPPGAGVNLRIPELGATPPLAVGIKGGENEFEAQMVVPPELFEEIGRLVSSRAPAAR